MIRTLSNLARTKFPGREFRPRRPFGEVAPNLAASLEVWPAAGGGLLLGMNVPVLAGAAPRRQPVKSLFLRVDTQGVATVIVPYVRLEAGVARRVSEMTSTELEVSSDRVAVDNRTAGQRPASEHAVDLCRSVEASLVLLAAVARSLMILAAAELRKAAVQDCLVKNGVVHRQSRRLASYADLATHAALVPLPSFVVSNAGHRYEIRRG
jgi:isoquinoline 1-oxidoreductase beta subunit